MQLHDYGHYSFLSFSTVYRLLSSLEYLYLRAYVSVWLCLRWIKSIYPKRINQIVYGDVGQMRKENVKVNFVNATIFNYWAQNKMFNSSANISPHVRICVCMWKQKYFV